MVEVYNLKFVTEWKLPTNKMMRNELTQKKTIENSET